MALFGKKNEAKKAVKKETKPKAQKASETGVARVDTRDLSAVILRPVITEKAAVLGEKNVYAFFIAKDAGKREVTLAVKKLWNVTPARVNIVNREPRAFVAKMRGRRGVHPGSKKAYVYLKEGDRIELV